MKINTPAINVLGETIANDEIATRNKTLTENWKNCEVDPVDPKCKLYYGVDKGDTFAYAVQEDFDDYVKLAAEMRQLEFNRKESGKDSWLGKTKWILPRIIKLEMEARGYPVEDIIATGDLYEIDLFVVKNFPELKTTNLILSRQKLPALT